MIGLNYQQPRTRTSPPPALSVNASYEARSGGAITSPFILYKTAFSCSTLPTLMWGAGAGTSFSVPNPGADTWTEEETIKSPHQARLLLTRPCLHLYILALAHALHWYYLQGLRSFLLCRRSLLEARVHHSFLCILGHHLLPQAWALYSLKLQLIQQDCMRLYTAMRLFLHLPSQRDFFHSV